MIIYNEKQTEKDERFTARFYSRMGRFLYSRLMSRADWRISEKTSVYGAYTATYTRTTQKKEAI